MMATAIPVSTTWIPEDDLLLKNAVEVNAFTLCFNILMRYISEVFFFLYFVEFN